MSDGASKSGVLGASMLPRRVFLADKPEVTVARPTLGLVLFLDDPEAWARGVCERLVELVGPASFRAFMTSALDGWVMAAPRGGGHRNSEVS